MNTRQRLISAAATVLVTLMIGACESTRPDSSGAAEQGSIEVNPRDPRDLREGGELRIAADQLPDNWNYYQLDGPTGDGYRMISTVLPTPWGQTADGDVQLDTDFVESATLTSQEPQVITYRLNPRARWSTGEPLSWRDFAAQADALSGDHGDYKVASTTGYENIAKVEAGATEHEVKVTFDRTFAEWQTIFSPLYPASMYGSSEEFNTGWLSAPKVTGGPFKIESIDVPGQSVTVVRDPNWWGTRPRLDRITFRVILKAELPDAMASGTTDFYFIGSNAELFERSQHIPGAEVRRAPATDYSTIAFNGTAGSILDDQDLRLAIQKGIDTDAIAKSVLGGVVTDPKPLGNHLFLHSAKAYNDNSSIARFDPGAARQKLDSLGWKVDGEVRTREGKTLDVRFVIGSGNAISQKVAEMVQAQLKDIGVKVTIEPVPAADYFKSFVNVGNFDLSTFRWLVTALPVTNSRGVYYLDPDVVNENYGRIGNETINALFDRTLSELDGAKRLALANQIDVEIWKSGSQLPLFQTSGTVAVRSTVANFGAAGYASVPYDWVSIGFTS